MNKKISIIIMGLFLFVSVVSALPDNQVEVVVLGMVNHDPIQPTVNAIKEVTSKYGSDVNLKLIDMENEEGQKYSKEHNLKAHLNVVINGKYQYKVNGNKITFQWFEGQQWSKEDLDEVISSLLNNKGNVIPVDNPKSNDSLNLLIIFSAIFLVIGAVAWFLIKKFKK
jgi:hypothetical protein